jgi:Holliday junction resolvase YEN1
VTPYYSSSNTLSGNRANPALNSAGKDDKNHTRVFRLEDITNHPDVKLTRGGLILIGLMSGGDYQQGGLMRCGMTTSHALAKCGFGDSLYEAARTLDREDLVDYLVVWRQELREELRTNSQGHNGRKQGALAKSITEDFPDIDILLSYVHPITSESMGRESNNTKLTWSKEPNLAKLAETCEFYFEWGYKEAIIKRFRTVIWHSVVLRILRRAVLDLDEKAASQTGVLATPRKKKTTDYCGTPSKMIAKHFSSMGLTTPSKAHSDSDSEDEDEDDRLILRVHSSRTHTSTDGLLEYRLEIAPKQLVRLTESGIKGIRVPEGPDEWASENEGDDEPGPKKRGKAPPIDPETTLRVWMPACMVKLAEPRLVQEFEDKEEQKRLKKAGKGTRRAAGPKEKAAPKEKAPRKTTKKAAAAAAKPTYEPFDDDLFASPARANNEPLDLFTPPSVAKPKHTTARAAPTARRVVSVSSSEDDENDSSDSDVPSRLPSKPSGSTMNPPSPPPSNFSTAPIVSDNTGVSTLSPVTSRIRIKDLTKKKPMATATATAARGLKSFYPVVQSSSSSSSITPRKPYNQPSTSTLPVGSSIGDDVVPDSEPPRAKARAELPRSALVPIEFRTASQTNLPPPRPKTQSFKSLEDSDDLSGDGYDPAIWATKPASGNPVYPSPPKRKAYRSVNSTSESESAAHLKKSPRKKASQTSPQMSRRPASPSPVSRLHPKKTSGDVIEITDSDSDSPSPAVSRNLPPLMAARARASARSASSSNSSASAQSALSAKPTRKKAAPIVNSDDIIDLT